MDRRQPGTNPLARRTPGMTTVAAYAAPAAKAPLERTTIERRAVREHDVLIDIKFAGICHSDIHQAREGWGEAIFPMVPGHEIAGVVSEVGPGVTKFQVGDRVGVGCMVDSCGECENCKAGIEQHCTQGNVPTYNGIGKDGEPTYGGYSEKVVVDENYVVRIPCCAPASPPTPRSSSGARVPARRSP
jgi:uncharacterized zinc-type alcohol dehydrogenase-like protein